MAMWLLAVALASAANAIRLQPSFQAPVPGEPPREASETAAQQGTSIIQITGYIYDVPFLDAPSHREEDLPSHVVFETPKPAEAGLRATIQNVSASTFRRPRVTFVSYTPGAKIETSPHGVPTVRSLFKAIFADHPKADTYTYVNSDIAVDGTFVATADAIAKAVRQGTLHERFLVVGRRTNVNWRETDTLSDATFDETLHKGEQFLKTAQDYFMVSQSSFDWEKVPPFIVGHRGYDNWLTGTAVDDPGMDVVDASDTLSAMHLTGRLGNWEGYNAKGSQDGPDYNMNLMAKYNTRLDYYCDDTDSTNWEAHMESTGVVSLVRRNTNKAKYCQERGDKRNKVHLIASALRALRD